MSTDETLLSNIKKLKIKYQKQIIEFKSFEELLSQSFMDILNSNDKKTLFIGVEKELMTVLLILTLSIEQYMSNMENPSNDILNIIKKGDKVVHRGDICIFDKIDIDKRYNNKYIYLLEKNNTTRLVPYEKSHLLTLYNGQSNRINKVNGTSQRYNITKKFISEVMEIDETKLNGVVKESTVIVFEHKEELYSLINSIEISFNEEIYLVSELFPFAYYTSEENYEYFKGNRIKENIVIKFASNISVAIDIIKDDENVRNIVLIGEKSYKDSLETELREAGMMDNIKKILLIDTWESKFNFSILFKDDEPFSVYAVTKEVVLSTINFNEDSLLNLESSLQKENYNLLINLINKDIHIYEADNSEILNENIYNINQNLKHLFDYSDSNMKTLEFIKIAYYLCNKLEQALLPLNRSANTLNSLIVKVDILKEIFKLYSVQRAEYGLMDNIIYQIEEIIKFLRFKNNKVETIKEKILNNMKSLLFIKNSDEIIKLKECFKTLRKTNLDIRSIDKKIGVYENTSLIVPAFFENKHLNILNTNIVRGVNIVVYRREKIRVNSLIRKNIEMLGLILKNNKLFNSEEFQLPRIVEHFLTKPNFSENKNLYDEEEKFNEIEDHVQRFIQENKIKLFIDEDRVRRGMSNSTMKVNKIITFEDENYSFLSDNFQANVIDRKNNDIKQKNTLELVVGDEMIFTKSKLYGEQDIVKVIIKELLNKEEFKDKYGEYFRLNNLWKNSLRNYMHTYDLTERDISGEFKVHGKQITSAAIVNWLNGNIIGPHDLDDIRTIAEIVKDNNLYKKLEEVIVACKAERKIQIQVRKSIAKIIINSLVNNNEKNNEMYDIVKSTISDLSKYAYIGTISSIENIEEEISYQYVNKVIERDE